MEDLNMTATESKLAAAMPESTPKTTTKQRRGFAAMDPSRQKELASRGGKASHAKGTGHEWSRDAARTAGKTGGIASGIARNRKKAIREAQKAAAETKTQS